MMDGHANGMLPFKTFEYYQQTSDFRPYFSFYLPEQIT